MNIGESFVRNYHNYESTITGLPEEALKRYKMLGAKGENGLSVQIEVDADKLTKNYSLAGQKRHTEVYQIGGTSEIPGITGDVQNV